MTNPPANPLSPPPIRAGDHLRWGGLMPGADALAIATAAARHAGTVLLVTATTEAAERLEDELHFFLGEGSRPVLRLPDWETLPYDRFSPHQDLVSDRLLALSRLAQGVPVVLVVPAATLMQRIAPVAFVTASTLALEPGQTLDRERLRGHLDRAGYRAVETVQEHGEFAVRGAIVDLFPMGLERPVRIELFDDEIATLRSFDPETQRSLQPLQRLKLLPGREFPLHDEAIAAFRRRWHERFDNDHRQCPVYQDIARGIAPPGIEYWLPLFFDGCATLFDYLPEQSLVFVEDAVRAELDHAWQGINERHASLDGDLTRPILRPAELFLPPDELRGRLRAFTRVEFAPADYAERAGAARFAVEAAADGELPAEPLARLARLRAAGGTRWLFCAESPGRRELLAGLLARGGFEPAPCEGWEDFLTGSAACALAVAPLGTGFRLPAAGITVVTESLLYGQRIAQRRRRARTGESGDGPVRSLAELAIGMPVVHVEHGIGRYLGLQSLAVDGQQTEFLCIEYAEATKLFVPVTALDAVSRYTGIDAEHVPLHKLGNEQWQKQRKKAAEQIRDVAAELLEIHARREARPGHACKPPDAAYARFAAAFPFEETADQQAAIEAVLADMCAPRAMDRLICGDVGFGKTEVAMRAAFMAVQDGRQVAVLVPTTLLAQQHFDTFGDRFADWPVTIESISRFKSAAEQKAVLERLEQGRIDIIIGTHSLLAPAVKYRQLGLLVIDEEHRFGVRQKEQLKALRATVDILTLTATPIPRTLNMALAGMRDLSIISTPPARRLAVKTFVQRHEGGVIKDAVDRELRRGGQVFVLHNDVQTMERRAQELGALLPEARIAIAHGQMRKRELERVMSDFYHKRANVLVCSTIIETGIDIPSANTIVIERADKFGLAQLHQLRGRVGRSHHQAYAFLLIPDARSITADAVKRLDALAGTDSLGAGFVLATHDLEIRGAGELLGEEQSGQIQAIGYSLYMELLTRAVNSLRAGGSADLEAAFRPALEVNLRLPALIPDDYLPDVHHRLTLYKRVSSALAHEELDRLQIEMIDRFGLLPEAAKNLFRVAALRVQALPLGITKLEASAGGGLVEFGSQTRVDPLTIVNLVQHDPRQYRLDGGTRLRFTRELSDPRVRMDYVEQLVARLAQPAADAPPRRSR